MEDKLEQGICIMWNKIPVILKYCSFFKKLWTLCLEKPCQSMKFWSFIFILHYIRLDVLHGIALLCPNMFQ